MEAFLKLYESERSVEESSNSNTGSVLQNLRNTTSRILTEFYLENIPSPAIKKMKPICMALHIYYPYILK